MSDPTVRALGARVSLWGEGPVWWANALHYVDIEGHAIVRLDPQSSEETVWDMGERVGTVVPRVSDGYLYAGDNGIRSFDPATGNTQTLADPEADKRPDNRFNDGKCDPAGRFWAGTISTVKKAGDAKLYMLDTDGGLHAKIEGLTNSNGICWSADGETLYHIDTPTRQVRAYPFEPATGALGKPAVVADTAEAGIEGSPDGMCIDTDGNLWIAICHGGCVVCFDPRTPGERPLRTIRLPAAETTACAFGGPKLDRLFVTTGQKRDADEPDAGRVFVIDGLAIRGQPANAFAG